MAEKEVRLIDANALDTLLEDVEKGYKKNFLFKSAKELRWIRDAISALRTIDPESLRLHGKWTADHRCTNCGEYAVSVWALPPVKDPESECYYHTIYCPWCGAIMDKDDDDFDEDDFDLEAALEADRCYECGLYGDDYSTDENGEMVCNCDRCPYNSMNKED